MNTTTFKAPVAPVVSPFQMLRKQAFAPQSKKKDPVRAEIEKCLGSFDISVTFQEDEETLRTFKRVPGHVAFLCTLKKGEEVIGVGRGSAVLNRMNRFIERTVRVALNGSFIDSTVRASKMLDALHFGSGAEQNTGEQGGGNGQSDGITEKQEKYLRELIQQNVEDEKAREEYILQIPELTKGEASSLIQGFAK